MSKFLLIAAGLIAAVQCADITSTLESIRQKGGAPALACAVWKGSSIVSIGATGVRKLGDRTRVTVDDKWHLGSETKAMTGALVAVFVDQGRIRFNDTMVNLFPGMTIHRSYQSVTIEQLLQQRGGMPEEIPNIVQTEMELYSDLAKARKVAAAGVLRRAPEYIPGTKYLYSNAGFVIVGAALEGLTGRAWEDLITEYLFRPLGMSSCGFMAPGSRSPVDQPWGHENKLGNLRPISPTSPYSDNPAYDGPAGTVHCSLGDWGKFLTMYLGETSFLTPATMTRLLTPAKGGDYAGGWGIETKPWTNGPALEHDGSNTLWYASAWVAPKRDLAFACTTNAGNLAAERMVKNALDSLIKSHA